MKRIFLFLLLLSFAFPSLSQEKKTYNIGILLDVNSPELDGFLEKLKTEIIAVVGEDAHINFNNNNVLINNYNLQKATANYNALITQNVDIILVTGVINKQVIDAQNTYVKPIILFGVYDKDKFKFENGQLTSNIPNFTPILIYQKPEEDLKTLKQLTDFKKVGIVVEKHVLENISLNKLYDSIVEELGVSYTFIPFDNVQDIVNQLTADIDAVYFAGGFLLSVDDIKEISEVLIEKKLPSITVTTTSDVVNGLMATYQSHDNVSQFFRRIALSVEAVVAGENLANVPIYLSENKKLTLNINTAKRIGVPLKFSLISSTNIVGNIVDVPSVKQYSLLDVMQIALQNNLNLKSSEQNTLLAAQDVKVAKSDFMPLIIASASGNYIDPELAKVAKGQNPEYSTSGSIGLNQTLFSEPAIANISIQKSLEKAELAWYDSEQLNAVYNASTAYFDCLILKANLQIQSKNLEVTKKNLQVAQQNYEAGQSGKSDVLRFQSEFAQNTQSLVEALSQLKKAYNALNKQLNNPIDMEISVKDAEINDGVFEDYDYKVINNFLDDPTLRTPFLNFLYEEALRNTPDLKALAYNLEATERSIKLYGLGRIAPKLSLRGQYNYEFSRSGYGTEYPIGFTQPPQGYYNVGLHLSIPIVDQNLKNINKQTATIQKDQLTINLEDTKLNLEKSLNDAVLNLMDQISNIELSDLSQRTAKESLELTQTSYESGAVNIVQLLDAQNNYLNAEQNKINAIYNYLLGTITIQRLIGDFHLLNSDAENLAFIQRFMDSLATKN